MPSEGEGRDALTSQRASKTASKPLEAKREVGGEFLKVNFAQLFDLAFSAP